VGEDCLTIEDGRRLYRRFLPELQAGREVELDFAGVQPVAASFFNASLGFLLRDFEIEELRRLVKVSHLAPEAQKVLLRVLKNCKRYYQRSFREPARHDLTLPDVDARASQV
jgi:hypothetical protein